MRAKVRYLTQRAGTRQLCALRKELVVLDGELYDGSYVVNIDVMPTFVSLIPKAVRLHCDFAVAIPAADVSSPVIYPHVYMRITCEDAARLREVGVLLEDEEEEE
jgi:hypothetical protein